MTLALILNLKKVLQINECRLYLCSLNWGALKNWQVHGRLQLRSVFILFTEEVLPLFVADCLSKGALELVLT